MIGLAAMWWESAGDVGCRMVVGMNVDDDQVYWHKDSVSRCCIVFFFSSRRRHTRLQGDWSSDVCSSDLHRGAVQTLSMGMAGAGEIWPSHTGGAPLLDRAASEDAAFQQGGPRDSLGTLSEIGRASCRERV